MIDLIPNSTSFRRVPYQSGNYSIELDINLSNHNHNLDFALSGAGSIFFRFGSNSGNYYASGIQKLYFDSTLPNNDLQYTFVISNSGYDVYDFNDNPLILGGVKNSGTCERFVVSASSAAAGQYSLILRGSKPNFSITSGMTFPIQSNFNDNVVVQNNTSVPFHLLSGTFDAIGSISGANRFPTFVNSNASVNIPFSGKTNLTSNQDISFILNADFTNTANVLTISGTLLSGSGYILTQPTPQEVALGGFTNSLWLVNNTGTTPLRFTPVVTNITSGINITLPQYSGTNVYNYFSGFFDTPSQFYMSDHISWSGGNFYIIQETTTGIGMINITGENSATPVSTGLLVGTNVNLSVGQTFSFPFDFYVTGVSLKLAVTGSGFVNSDSIFISLYNGNGVSGSVITNSNSLLCPSIPTGIGSGQNFYFRFPTPAFLLSGNSYSFAIGGSPSFIGNTTGTPSRQVVLLRTTGNVYPNGSGFFYDGTTTFTTGDALIKVDWYKPLNSIRYQVNSIVGATNQFFYISTGTYDKYQDHLSFVFSNNEVEALPNTPMSIPMTYTGLVQGMNFARLTFTGLGYTTIISGLTT